MTADPTSYAAGIEADISEADKQTLERVQETLPIEDLEALERIVEARINRALAAAPPPPVPAQAESGPSQEWWNKRCAWYNDRIRELQGEVARLRDELARVWQTVDAKNERIVQVRTAAQAARDALEPFATSCHNHFHDESILDRFDEHASVLGLIRDGELSPTGVSVGGLRRAREALASLASVLGGAE